MSSILNLTEFDINQIFNIKSQEEFDIYALKIFAYQFNHVEIYKKYISLLGLEVKKITSTQQIPYLPIQLFKTHKIIADGMSSEIVFKSSATSGIGQSSHYVANKDIYEKSFKYGFEKHFGKTDTYIIIGLLPSYIEKGGSSLVYMVDHLIRLSNQKESNFYLNNFDELRELLKETSQKQIPVILFGVTYALLDFAEKNKLPLEHVQIIETGGMKGRREEITKEELHEVLTKSFSIESIGGEYGMTELLSQAYSTKEGIYKTPPWMRVVITDINDPFKILGNNQWGKINVIDLANVYSCSFIATEDIGQKISENEFKIAGRIDNSDTRGCSLLYI